MTAPLIYWSVDPEDWKYRNAETVRSNIEAGVFDGAIILVHDIYKTSVDGALAAIDDLLAEGYEFVTVQDLLLRRGVTPEAATVYYSAKTTGSICRRCARRARRLREPHRDTLGLRRHEDLSGLRLDDADGHGRMEAERICYAGGVCCRSCPLRGHPHALSAGGRGALFGR